MKLNKESKIVIVCIFTILMGTLLYYPLMNIIYCFNSSCKFFGSLYSFALANTVLSLALGFLLGFYNSKTRRRKILKFISVIAFSLALFFMMGSITKYVIVGDHEMVIGKNGKKENINLGEISYVHRHRQRPGANGGCEAIDSVNLKDGRIFQLHDYGLPWDNPLEYLVYNRNVPVTVSYASNYCREQFKDFL